MKTFIPILVLYMVYNISAKALPFSSLKSCGGTAELLDFKFGGCDLRGSCGVDQNWIIDVTADVQFDADIDALDYNVYAHDIYWAPIPILLSSKEPLGEGSACQLIQNGDCPVKANEITSFKYEVQMPGSIPRMNGLARIELVDRNQTTQLCIDLPITSVF